MKISKLFFIILFIFPALGTPAAAEVSLKGTGSALDAPLLLKLTAEYQGLHPGVKLRYETKNPTDAINQILGRGADFAATDSPLTAGEERKTAGRALLHLPLAIGAVAATYNLPGVPSGLRLTPALLSKIFMGTVKKWNDPALRELNPEAALPNMDILVLHREEESSLHDLFPGFLARLDPQWTLKHEKEKNLRWPAGKNLKGNERVLEKMRKWPGVIAAVDFSFAAQNHLPMAEVRNTADQFVAPSRESLLAAAADWVNLPEDFNINLGRSRDPQAYPLCSFTWILVYQDPFKASHDHPRSRALVEFLDWIYADGQKTAEDLFFAPLPAVFLEQVRAKVKTMAF